MQPHGLPSTSIRPGHQTYPLRGLHIVVMIAIAVAALVQLARSWYPVLAGVPHPRLLSAEPVYQGSNGPSQMVLYTAAILFMIWLWRARKNLDAFPASTATLGAGWAIGAWLVPVANLFIPYLVLTQVTRNSSPSKAAVWLVRGWWLGYLGQVVGLVALITTDNWIPSAAIGSVLWTMAGGFLIAIVATVTTGQHTKISTNPPAYQPA